MKQFEEILCQIRRNCCCRRVLLNCRSGHDTGGWSPIPVVLNWIYSTAKQYIQGEFISNP